MSVVIIVEGKNDKAKLRRLLSDEVEILCTFGTPGTHTLADCKRRAMDKDVFIWTDNDPSGRKIRAILTDTFPDSEHIYTRKGYAGVEGTPDEYLISQLEKAGLEEYIFYPDPDPILDSIRQETVPFSSRHDQRPHPQAPTNRSRYKAQERNHNRHGDHA